MLNQWKNILLLIGALALFIIGLAGLVLPIIPGVILIVAGAVVLDRAYPQLKHHPRVTPHLKKLTDYFNQRAKK